MDRVKLAPAPVEREQGVLILGRKLGPIAERHSRWRARANVDYRRQGIGIKRGPFARAVPPAKIGATHHMANPRRSVPGKIHVAFVIGIEREQVTVAIHGRIERIAKATGDDFPVLAIG